MNVYDAYEKLGPEALATVVDEAKNMDPVTEEDPEGAVVVAVALEVGIKKGLVPEDEIEPLTTKYRRYRDEVLALVQAHQPRLVDWNQVTTTELGTWTKITKASVLLFGDNDLGTLAAALVPKLALAYCLRPDADERLQAELFRDLLAAT